jgi:hypothetical protein
LNLLYSMYINASAIINESKVPCENLIRLLDAHAKPNPFEYFESSCFYDAFFRIYILRERTFF